MRTERWERGAPIWCLFVVLLGSLVRVLFGWYKSIWLGAADQMVWGLGIEDALEHGLSGYAQLIHYPHEGGTLPLSMLAMLFKPLDGILPPLSWAALVVDSICRYVQIRCGFKWLGTGTGTWFAAWTVLAAPVMLPWATLNCGMHALVSFTPFVLLHMVLAQRAPLMIGLVGGVLASLSYEVWTTVVAIGVVLIGFRWERSVTGAVRMRGAMLFVLGCMVGCLPHFCARAFLDNGFQLEDMSSFSVRGLEGEGFAWSHLFTKTTDVLFSDLPASFAVEPLHGWSLGTLAVIVLIFLFVGLVGVVLTKGNEQRITLALLLVLSLFLLAVIIGPFHQHSATGKGYLYFRYFPYIAPLLVLLMLHGFARWCTTKTPLRAGWLVLCAAFSFQYMWQTATIERPNLKAMGWVIARKYGHAPARVLRLIDLRPEADHADLLYGAGWGTAAALFDRRSAQDTTLIPRFEALMGAYSPSDRGPVSEGVQQAFREGITPRLDDAWEPLVEDALQRARSSEPDIH